MTTVDMIKVMQHYADGGEVEACIKNGKLWHDCNYPEWNWNSMDYRIKEQKQKVIIEKWLLKDADGRFFIKEGDENYMSYNFRHKVQLLKIYEVEL